ncbi:MAG: sigma-54-dependent transcriptional regulator [Fimbriimonas sp.]
MKKRILIVDDEASIRRILQVAFDKAGYVADIAADAREAAAKAEAGAFDCVLTDVTMPGKSGHELLRELKKDHPELPVIVMTAFGTIPQAVQAIRDGAHEYITKPFDLEHLRRVVAGAIDSAPKAVKPKTKAVKGVVAESPAMREVLETVDQVADSKATVMIGGESGVGKEVVARLLHERSTRAAKPFVAVSCAAIPDTLLESELFGHEKGAFTGANTARAGRFEATNGGTLFLDEIGDVPMSMQVKLLRVIQERTIERLGSTKPTKIDVRLVTATHRDLRQAVDAGTFRLDLLYRLQVVELVIPPLRERPEDILAMARHFLAKFAVENGAEALEISDEAAERLLAYRWPGNVRELENVMERATVLAGGGGQLVPRLLPTAVRQFVAA